MMGLTPHPDHGGSETERHREELLRVPEHIYQFGAFTLRPDTGELSKHGIRLKLQIKPLLILKTLIERPGELVTREELCKKLWPEGTFVDFESGLNTATNRLRTTLGDSADSPRYIETLPRLGYRFICPVQALPRVPVSRNLQQLANVNRTPETHANGHSTNGSPARIGDEQVATEQVTLELAASASESSNDASNGKRPQRFAPSRPNTSILVVVVISTGIVLLATLLFVMERAGS